MKVLICTQIVDSTDPALGFFHAWIEEFSRGAEEVHVVCLKEGEHAFPSNVFVYSLGKEKGTSRLKRVWRVYRYVWILRNRYEAVFVHMNPEYVVLAGLLWRLLGKHIGLWYTHRTVDLKLRVATLLMHQGFTGSKESFQIDSPKILVTGQGVDTTIFVPNETPAPRPLTLVVVGRIAPIKNLELAIDTFAEVHKTTPDARLAIVGAPVKPEDFVYQEHIRAYSESKGLTAHIDMLGGKDSLGVLQVLRSSDIFLHTSQTNSADKTIVEAMAVGVYVLTSSPVYVKDIPSSCAQPPDAEAYAREIQRFVALPQSERKAITQALRQAAIERHSLARLIKLILLRLSEKR